MSLKPERIYKKWKEKREEREEWESPKSRAIKHWHIISVLLLL